MEMGHLNVTQNNDPVWSQDHNEDALNASTQSFVRAGTHHIIRFLGQIIMRVFAAG